jgi:hypothetical protein
VINAVAKVAIGLFLSSAKANFEQMQRPRRGVMRGASAATKLVTVRLEGVGSGFHYPAASFILPCANFFGI